MDIGILRGGLIVSCQAHGDHPLRNSSIIAALAECAERGGAKGIRADGPEDVAEIKARVSVPVVGIYKTPLREGRFLITPSFDHARVLAEAGADFIALEATFENRPDKRELQEAIDSIRTSLRIPVMADISGFKEGVRAWELGTDLVATTLSGHTSESRNRKLPDLDLVGRLAAAGVRVVCEGHVQSPEQVSAAFDQGAWSVVVGTVITDPLAITSRFARSAQDVPRGSEVRESDGVT